MKKLLLILAVTLLCGCETMHQSPSTLLTVTRQVNHQLSYQADSDDRWDTDAKMTGDCEDNALTKARRLVEKGYDPSSLELVIGYDRRGRPHSVLLVKRHLVLDLQNDQVLPLAESTFSGYMACNLGSGRYGFFPANNLDWAIQVIGKGGIANRGPELCAQAARDLKSAYSGK